MAQSHPKHLPTSINYRKCMHHIYSYHYATNLQKHDQIIKSLQLEPSIVPMEVKIIFHFLAPVNSYHKNKVIDRSRQLIQSLNDDFNNYSSNENQLNNLKYKTIINEVFYANVTKQNIYSNANYSELIPVQPANINFILGEIYYYPHVQRLNLSMYDDFTEVEIAHQAIKKHIHQSRANAIHPDRFINIWVVDIAQTGVLSYSSFPWETINNHHGIVLHRRVFFPEEYDEHRFHLYKSLTHAMGHYFGLLHVYTVNGNLEPCKSTNLNVDNDDVCHIAQNNTKLLIKSDPMDKQLNKNLHTNLEYNPLFMNFMDYTEDSYTVNFTINQIQKMKWMIRTYLPLLIEVADRPILPAPKFNPEATPVLEQANYPDLSIIAEVEKDCSSINYPTNSTVSPETLYHYPTNYPVNSTPPMEPFNYYASYAAHPITANLTPNLASNNIIPKGNPNDQIIANIQKSLPTYTTNDYYRSPTTHHSPIRPPNHSYPTTPLHSTNETQWVDKIATLNEKLEALKTEVTGNSLKHPQPVLSKTVHYAKRLRAKPLNLK